jgi:tetratricopeptide (TPR) repeat protein
MKAALSPGQKIPVVLALIVMSACMVRTDAKIHYGMNHYEMGLYGHAIAPLRTVAARLDGVDPTDPRLPRVLEALGEMAWSSGRTDLAEEYFARNIDKVEHLDPPNERWAHRALTSLGLFLRSQKRSEEAIPLLARARDIARAWTDDRRGYAIALDNLSLACADVERWDEAIRHGDEALSTLDELEPSAENDRTRAVILFNRAWSFDRRGERSQAEPHYVEAIQIFERHPIPDGERWRLGVMLESYAELLAADGRVDEAAAAARRAKDYRR